MCLLRKTILFFPIQCYIIIHWKNFVFLSWIPGGEITQIKEKNLFLYMTLKKKFFHIF